MKRNDTVSEYAPLGWTLEHAPTADGWNLALYRYNGGDRERPPVILCGGYACNRHFFDFNERYSLARYLARRGFDAWVLELRGRGASHAARAGVRFRWTFDDLAVEDAPAAIEFVAERCERPPVWVGHSMGGMVAYAALGSVPTIGKSLSGLVTLASPVTFTPVGSSLAHLIGEGLLAASTPFVPQRRALVGIWWAVRNSPRVLNVGMNAENVDRSAFGKALRSFICNVPKDKLRQFVRWHLSGTFRSIDGRLDYANELRSISVPSLLIAGAADRLASPQSVQSAYASLGSSFKTYREFGAASGDSADYGHVDLVFGRHAPEEVFAEISRWIEESISKG